MYFEKSYHKRIRKGGERAEWLFILFCFCFYCVFLIKKKESQDAVIENASNVHTYVYLISNIDDNFCYVSLF